MKRLVALLFVIMVSAVIFAEWEFEQEVDLMHGSKITTASTLASVGTNSLGLKPLLVIRLTDNRLSIFVAWREYVGDGILTVTTRFEDTPPTAGRWNSSASYTASFFTGASLVLLRQMIEKKEYIVSIKPPVSHTVAVKFDLTGLKEGLLEYPEFKAILE